MNSFAGLTPPPEIVELGAPDRVYRSQVSSGMVIATYVMGTLAWFVGGGLIVLKDVLGMVPDHAGNVVYALAAVFVGGAALMMFSLSIMRASKPKHLYALYPVGVVIYQKGEWGLVPWINVVSLDERSDPALLLENQAVIPIAQDIGDWHDLLHDIRQYILAKDGMLGLSQGMVLAPLRRRGKLRMLAGAALLIGAGTMTYLTWDWMVEMNQPAKVMTMEELSELRDPTTISRGWVSIDVPQVIRTKVEMQERRFVVLGTVESKFVLLPVKDSYLIAMVKNDFKEGKGVKGVLAVWKGDGGRYSQEKLKALDALEAAFPKYKARLLPFQFDATVPLESQAKALPVGLGLAGLFGLWYLLTGWSQARRQVARVAV